MKTYADNPAYFRLDILVALGVSQVHELARKSVGTLTTYRVVLGRCLLAMRETKGFKKYGCSSEIHYAISRLGISESVACSSRRVARELMKLPQLTMAAEQGAIGWSKLRELTRKATHETEGFWLEMAGRLNYKSIQKLVSETPNGAFPGDVFEEPERATNELRCVISEEVLALLDRARRQSSLEQGKAVTTSEILECALTSFVANQSVDSMTLEKVREDMDKDLQAQKAREIPLVAGARQVAAEMGYIPVPVLDTDLDDEMGELDEGARAGEPIAPNAKTTPVKASSTTASLLAPRAGDPIIADPQKTSERANPTTASPLSARAGDETTSIGPGRTKEETPTADHAPGRTIEEIAPAELGDDFRLSARAGDKTTSIGPGRTKEETPTADHAPGRVNEESELGDDSNRSARADRHEQTPGALAGISCCTPATEVHPETRRANQGFDNDLTSTGHAGENLTAYEQALAQALGGLPSRELAKINLPARATISNSHDLPNSRLCFNPHNRNATQAQRKVILRRQGWCCATPGCTARLWLHLHHLIPYSQGGPTLPSNLLGLCFACHCNVHDGYLRIFQTLDGRLIFTDAEGNSLAKQADLELAAWLDRYQGWEGGEEKSYSLRARTGGFAVFDRFEERSDIAKSRTQWFP